MKKCIIAVIFIAISVIFLLMSSCSPKYSKEMMDLYNSPFNDRINQANPKDFDCKTYYTDNYSKVCVGIRNDYFHKAKILSYADYVLAFETLAFQSDYFRVYLTCNNFSEQEKERIVDIISKSFSNLDSANLEWIDDKNQIQFDLFSTNQSLMQKLMDCDNINEILICGQDIGR